MPNMPEVSIYVALITGVVALAPQAAIWAQNERQARRDRYDRKNGELRQACLDLFSAAAGLRVQVENNHHYHGTEMGPRMELVRQRAADASDHATNIALMTSADLGNSALRLANAVTAVAASATARVDVDRGRSVLLPDFTEMDAQLAEFKTKAVEAARAAIATDGPRSRRRA